MPGLQTIKFEINNLTILKICNKSNLMKQFYIYTTGIVNWGNFDDKYQNLINLWNDGVLSNIINRIPKHFNIFINHFDPLFSSHETNMNDERIKSINKYVKQNLITKDMLESRVIYSSFLYNEFNPDNIKKPHLIIDFAHLYEYVNFQNIVMDFEKNLFDLTVLRTGFIGNGEFNHLSCLDKIFEIDQNGITITYIDKMIQLEYDFDKTEPIDCLKKIFNKSISKIEQHVKVLKSDDNGNIPPYYKVEHIGNEIINKPQIVSLLFDMFWKEYRPDNIINGISDEIISTNLEKIMNTELL
jgi:hypothetical protein